MTVPEPPDVAGPPAGDDSAPRFVRPYTITAGRTRSKVELPFEARLRVQVSAVDPTMGGSVRRVLDCCDARSVAEVSAEVGMPIGVVRVLVGDLVEQGKVRVQETLTDSSSKDERIALIERTLRGLRSY